MLSYFIIDKSGSTIFQSIDRNRNTRTSTNAKASSFSAAADQINESYRICYLPLLVIKDLIKANLHDAMQYVKLGRKTVVFKEQQGLLYIAYTKKKNASVELLQRHLRLMHQFLKFHFGPHWQLHFVKGKQQQKKKAVGHRIYGDIRKCLSLLPFVSSSQQPASLSTSDKLCYNEQVQLNDELRNRLLEHLTYRCNTSFSAALHQYQTSTNNNNGHSGESAQHPQLSKQRHQHRHSIFIANNLKKFNIHSFEMAAEREGGNNDSLWLSCYLVAREKIVVECRNQASTLRIDTKEPFLYFIRLLASNYLMEKQEYGQTARNNMMHTMPQNISQSISSTTMHQDRIFSSASAVASHHLPNNSSATINTNSTTNTGSLLSIKSENSSSTTINSSGQPSSLAYVYEGSSGSNAPFKIKGKSASSVIIAPESNASPHWSNPFSSSALGPNQNDHAQQHLIPSVHKTPSNVITTQQDQYIQQMLIADLLNVDKNFSNRYHALHNTISPSSYLSSSLPSDSTITSSPSSMNTTASINQLVEQMPLLSTTSPIHRSRSHSFTTTSSTNNSEDLSLRYLLTNLINNEISYSDQIEDVRLVKRWVRLEDNGTSNNRLLCANILLVILSEGLCAAVIFGDTAHQEQISKGAMSSAPPGRTSWKPLPAQVKNFKKGLRSYLADFESFLLTKESTHFTMLSFAVTFPGLIHFVHFDYERGTMTAPLLIDLNDLDKNHELLHQVYEKYQHTDRQWIWPSEPLLTRLCAELLHLSLECKYQRHVDHFARKSKDKEHYLLYQERQQHGLLAIYFDGIPFQQLSRLHQQLFEDVSQRVW